MWSHPACVDNAAVMKRRGVEFVGPVEGHVACGSAAGAGRLASVGDILAAIRRCL